MKPQRQHRTSAYLVGLLTAVIWTAPSSAYLDPASGSMLLQLILGGIAGAIVAVRLFWHRILGFFSSDESYETGD